MAVIFSGNKLGAAVGIQMLGSSPVRRLEIGVDSPYDRLDVVGQITTLGQSIQQRVEGAGRWWKHLIFGKVENITELGGQPEEPQAPSYNYSVGSKAGLGSDFTQYWTERTRQSLGSMLSNMGFVTSINIAFQDTANVNGIKMEAGTSMTMGSASIGGVVFEGSCNVFNRHGLEPILEYYYHHRVSNTDKKVTATILKVGETRLRGWVDGMTAQPMNLDYRLWSWTINMKLSPMYVPRPIGKQPPKTVG